MIESKTYYKGIEIDRNINAQFGSTYFSIVNTKVKFKDKNGITRNPHTHSSSPEAAKHIIDCYYQLLRFGFSNKYRRGVRDKALRLLNYKITY